MIKLKLFMYFIGIGVLLLWIADVNAHETKQEKVQEVIVSQATEDNHDEILRLRNRLQELEQKYGKLQSQEIKEHRQIQQTIKAIPRPAKPVVVKEKPFRNPNIEMKWEDDRYWAANPEDYGVVCLFEATAKQDLDKRFILNSNQELGYKIKFTKPPSLVCREL